MSNPALMPYGGKYIRWLGLKTTFSAGTKSIEVAQNILGAGGESGETESGPKEFVRSLLISLFMWDMPSRQVSSRTI